MVLVLLVSGHLGSRSGTFTHPIVQNHARKLLECAVTDESKSFAHVLHGNVYFHSAPPAGKEPKQEEKRFGVRCQISPECEFTSIA